MIEPTHDDVGRKVIYTAWHNLSEEGVITSFNDQYIFVRYGGDVNSKATRRTNLDWINTE